MYERRMERSWKTRRPIRNGGHARLEITRIAVGTRPRQQESVFIL